MQRILIIGSKGFIGQHLSRYLEERELDVYGADVVVDYASGDKYFLVDASNADYHQIFERHSFTICINCSGAASVPDSLRIPLRDFQLNTVNVYKLLNAIRDYQPGCRFVNLSSAAVYGNPSFLPVRENSKREPVSPYGLHKMMSELACESFSKHFNIATCSLRIFSAYGEGLKKQLFWDLYKKSLDAREVLLFGTGNETRDFIYIQDLCSAIWLCIQHSHYEAECINIANGKGISIRECAETFYSFFENPPQIGFGGETRAGDPLNWAADISTLSSFGYQPLFELKEGLRNYYTWIQKQG